MNREDHFEQKLRDQPQRPVPPSWRNEILRAARAPAGPQPVALSQVDAESSGWRTRLQSLFWPHPKAWAGLAATWLLILGFHLASREPAESRGPRQAGSPSPQIRQLLLQQEQLLAELVGPSERPQLTPPKSPLPQPRSQRREQFIHV